MDEVEQYMTPKEAAAKLRISDKTIYQWITEKRLPADKIGGAVRIPERKLARWIELNKTTTGRKKRSA